MDISSTKITGGILIVAGLIIFLWPGLTFVAIAVIAGVAFLVTGVSDIVTFIRLRDEQLFTKSVLLYAALDVIIGLVLLLNVLFFANAIPWLVGLIMVVLGAAEIYTGWRAKDAGEAFFQWIPPFFIGGIGIVCGVAFLFASDIFGIIIAILLVLRGLSMIAFDTSTGTFFRTEEAKEAAHEQRRVERAEMRAAAQARQAERSSASSRQASRTQRQTSTPRQRQSASSSSGQRQRRYRYDDDIIEVEPTRVSSEPIQPIDYPDREDW